MTKLEERNLDISKSRQILQLEYGAQLRACRFSPCGEYLMATSYDGNLVRWKLDETTARTTLVSHHGWAWDLEFHPSEPIVYSADSWGMLCSWPYKEENPQPHWKIEQAHESWIRDVKVSGDGKLLATCGDDHEVKVWGASDGTLVARLEAHTKPVHSISFHNNENRLVSGDLTGRIIDWDLTERKIAREFDASVLHNALGDGTYVGGGVRGMEFSTDGKKLLATGITNLGSSVVAGFPAALQFDWNGGMLDLVLRPHNYEHVYSGKGLFVEDICFHPEGFVVGCGGNGEREGAIWFWKLGEPEPIFEINGNPGSRSLDLHPDKFRLAVSQFKENGRGINGGNGKHAEDKEYHDHDGLIRIYELAAAPMTVENVPD